MSKRLLHPALFGPWCLVLLIWQLPVPAFAQAQPQATLAGKNILVLHSHEANAPVFLRTDSGLSTTLQSGGVSSLNQFFESLNLRRNPGSDYRKLLVEKMRMQYSYRKPDLIISMYPEALEFVLRDCRDIFPDVPILALYLPRSFESPKTDRRIIGHSATFDILGTFEIALNLVPGAKRVYVVSGIYEIDRGIEDQARRDLKKWETRLEFLYLSHMSFEDILATISSVPPRSIILLLVLGQDVKGTKYTYPVVAQRLSQVSAAPIFGILDTALGHGIVGGSLVNFEHIGSKAGEIVLDILRGIPPPRDSLEILKVPPTPTFDWRQLRRWKLSEAALPKGSIVINRELTFWDFKYYIIGCLAFCLVETTLIIFLVVQRRHRRSAEEALRERLRFEGLVSNLSAGFVNAALNEIDSQINNGLRSITEFFEADRCSIGLFSEDRTQLVRAFEYHSAEAEPAAESLSKEQLPWYMEQLIRGNPFVMNRVEDLPPEAEKERQLCLVKGMKSVLSLPMVSGGKTFGFCTLVSTRKERVWREELVPRFRLVSEVFSNALERKQAEVEVTHARAELLRVQRLTHLSELTASLSHELNQPLAAILSSAQAALRFLQSATPDLNLFGTILQNIVEDDKRAAGVIRSLRSLVKGEVKEKEPLDINEVLWDVLPLFRSEAIIRNVEIKTDFDNSLPPVRGDKVQLQQVVLNLFMNATEAMSQIPPQQRMIILRTHATDDNIQVAVQDSGPGIASAKIGDIWQPFFTTKGTGLGIGLNICTSIIQAHGGRIWAENNPDGGATFLFELPVMITGNP
jgi:signal transduction histidine kinase